MVKRKHSKEAKQEKVAIITPPTQAQAIDEEEDIGGHTFRTLGLCEEVCLSCDALGWKSPTLIQAKVMEHALAGRDLIGLAETGSGKTGAFMLPIVHKLLETPRRFFALVLSPTRELCTQIAEVAAGIGATIGVEVATLIGGLDMVTQSLALSKKPHIIVGSPGRVIDHLDNTKGFSLKAIRFLVLDEADRLLSMDFEEAINTIIKTCPTDRQTFLFSATMTSKVSKLQRASLKEPAKIEVNTKYTTVKGLKQSFKFIPQKFKYSYIYTLLSQFNACSSIIFSNTCIDAMKIAIMLRKLGLQAICLHGRMTQPQRMGALNAFKSTSKNILVATEVGSRGLDIPNVDMVVNFDVPMSSKDYVHRVGRTARAGKVGKSVTAHRSPPRPQTG
eukprot:GHVO01066917.1.p1 GENE.GHVO01066917.1~~GHVO01066917.1.p1  ORF type:complete len:389 (+),score=57.58 GHVO01066917.1:26-1192(+)